jgi:hypothetical protein
LATSLVQLLAGARAQSLADLVRVFYR